MTTLISILYYTNQHALFMLVGLLLGMLVGVPLALMSYAAARQSMIPMHLIRNASIVSPFALLALLQPWLGFCFITSLSIICYFNVLCIAHETLAGLHRTDRKLLLSSKSLGLSRRTELFKIQLPLVLPDIIIGARNGILVTITAVTISSYFNGSGGLGHLIHRGFDTHDAALLRGTALALIVLLVITENLFAFFERKARNYFSLKRFRNSLPFLLICLLIILAMHWLTNYYGHLSILRHKL